MATIIMPNTRAEVQEPLVFLLGPIRGAPSWHDEAMGNLLAERFDLAIATPARAVSSEYANLIAVGSATFPRQRAYEWHYIERAAKKAKQGVVLCWLPGEKDHRCEKVYGAMTRIELGELMMWRRFDPSIRFCIGTDGRFPEFATIQYDLQQFAPDVPVYRTLEETCRAALEMVR